MVSIQEEYERSMKVFRKVSSFYDLQKAYLKFLYGDILISPGNGSLKEDTLQELHLIIKINELGFVTTRSQGGLVEDSWKQRAYIVGLMQQNDAYLFLKELSVTSLIGTVNPVHTFPNNRSCDYARIPVSLDDGKIVSWISLSDDGESLNNILEKVRYLPLEDLCCVAVIDPVYGRKEYLAKKIIRILVRTQA